MVQDINLNKTTEEKTYKNKLIASTIMICNITIDFSGLGERRVLCY